MTRQSKLFLIALAVLGRSLGFSQTCVFTTLKGSERISLREDGTCMVVSNGRTQSGRYKINAKRITLDLDRRHIEGFWYGDVIRFQAGHRYRSLTLAKTGRRRP